MAAPQERRSLPALPVVIVVGLAVLGALWLVRLVVGLIWTLVQLAAVVLFVVVVVKVFSGRRRPSRG